MEDDEDEFFTKQFERLPRVQFGVKTSSVSAAYIPPPPSKIESSTIVNETEQPKSPEIKAEEVIFSGPVAQGHDQSFEAPRPETTSFSLTAKIITGGVAATGIILLALLAYAAEVTDRDLVTLALVALAGVTAGAAGSLYILNYALSWIAVLLATCAVESGLIVWMIFESTNQCVFIGLLIFAAGVAVVDACFVISLEIKLRLFGDYTRSGFVGWCWGALVFHVLVLLPCLLVRVADDAWIISMSFAAGLLCIVGAVFLGLGVKYLKRNSESIVLRLKKSLRKIGVRADIRLLRQIYNQYSTLGPAELKHLLVSGTNYFWWKVPETDPDLRYSKVLVPYALYQRLLSFGNSALWMPDFKVKPRSRRCWEALSYFKVKGVIVPVKVEDMMPGEILIEQGEVSLDSNSLKGVSLSQMEVQDLSFVKSSVLSLEGVQFLQSSYPDLEEISPQSLSAYDLEVIARSEMAERLRKDVYFRRKWLLYVFDTFARGDYERFKARWMTQDNIAQLVRLSGLYLSSMYLDELYSEVTHRLEPDGRMTFRLITFQVFLHDVVPAIAQHVFLEGAEVEARLVVEVMYPHLITNVPSLAKLFQKPVVVEKRVSSDEEPFAEATTNRPASPRTAKEEVKEEEAKSCWRCCCSATLIPQTIDYSDELSAGLTSRVESPEWSEIISLILEELKHSSL
jgi:hypothetical protein